MKDYKLCYVDCVNDWYTYKLDFTSSFVDQWGDDWNDRPADSNAGSPYEDEKHKIVSMYVEFTWDTTHDLVYAGKTYSVEDINRGLIPWILFGSGGGLDYKLLAGQNILEVLTLLEVSHCAKYYLGKDIVDMISGDNVDIQAKAKENLASLGDSI